MRKSLPASEYRREYFKKLVSEHQTKFGSTVADARKAITQMVLLMEDRIFKGDAVDIGFMVIRLKKKPPKTFVCNLKGKNKRTFCIGEHGVWVVNVHKHWQVRTMPAWSKY